MSGISGAHGRVELVASKASSSWHVLAAGMLHPPVQCA
jgi:hypothetical protein